MAKVVGSGISWQRVKSEENGRTEEFYKQRNAVNRHNQSPTRQSKRGRDFRADNNKPAQRPSTAVGFHDYFDDTESGRRLRALNVRRSLRERKNVILMGNQVPHRNCVSAVDEKLGAIARNNQVKINPYQNPELFSKGDLDFNDKIKTFRAMVSPQQIEKFKHISSEQLKKMKTFSDGIEEVGPYIKFKVTSADNNEMWPSTPSRLLNEAQLTHEQDKERTRSKTRPEPRQDTLTDTTLDSSVRPNFTNCVTGSQNGAHDNVSRDRQFNECQLTFKQDLMRCKTKHDFSQTCTFDNHRCDYFGCCGLQDTKDKTSDYIDSVKSVSFKHASKRIMKRPTDNTVRRNNGNSDTVHSPEANKIDYLQDLLSTKSFVDQEKLHYTQSSTTSCGHYENEASCSGMYNVLNGGTSPDVMKTDRMFSSDILLSVPSPCSVCPENNNRRTLQFTAPNTTTIASDKTLNKNAFLQLKSQSGILTTSKCRSDFVTSSMTPISVPDIVVLVTNVSLQDHFNALGPSLASVSSKRKSELESECVYATLKSDTVKTFTTNSFTKEGQQADPATYGYSKTGQHQCPPLSMQAALNNNIQTSASTANGMSSLKCKNDHLFHQRRISESSTVESVHSSLCSNVDTLKQTNVKLYDTSGDSIISPTNNISKKNESKNFSFRADSPRQTNISIVDELAFINYFPKSGTNKKYRPRAKCKTELKGTPGCSQTYGQLSEYSDDATDASDNSDIRQKVLANNMDVVVTDKDYNAAGDSRSLDFKNSDDHSPMKYSNSELEKMNSSQGFVQSLTKKYDSQTRRVQSQMKDMVRPAFPQSPELIAHEIPISKVSNTETNFLFQNSDKEKPSTIQKVKDVNVAQKRILVKRPSVKLSKTGIQINLQENEKLKMERCNSAIDISLGNINVKSSEQKLQCRKRPESSLGNVHSSAKNQKHLNSHQTQKSSKRTLSLEGKIVGQSKVVPLEKKVHQLHQEVTQRLTSKENVSYGFSSLEFGENYGSSKTGKSSEDLSDVSTIIKGDICNGLINVNSKSSTLFTTSTPVKHVINGGGFDGIHCLTESACVKQESAISDSRADGLKSQIYFIGREINNQDRTVRKSSNSLINSSKEINVSTNKLTSEATNLQLLAEGVKTCSSNSDLEDIHLHSSTISGLRQRSEISPKETPNHTQNMFSGNLASDCHGSQTMSMTHQNVYEHPLYAKLRSMFVNNQGRASPAELLLNHLDNPYTVRLLQKLYKADYDTRQIIMIKVEYFNAWQIYTVTSRKHRARKEILTKKSITFCAHRLLHYHFSTWQLRASHSQNMRQAIALYRSHVLTKGMKALKGSVNQSKHLFQRLQTTVHAIIIKASFQKWRIKIEQQRRECLDRAVKQWRQFVSETQIIRHMKQVRHSNIMMEVLHHWKKCYIKRLKMNIAFSFFRKALLQQVVACWQVYLSQCREKKEKYWSSMSHHRHMLLKSSFHTMIASYSQAKKAGTHFRCHQVSKIFKAWKKGIQICLVERQEEMTASKEHWQKQTLKQKFANWKEKLMINRAAKKADFNILRRKFILWKQAWETNIIHYRAIETAVTCNKLHRVFLTWRKNVTQLQQRHKLAVGLIESCYMRHIMHVWKMYIATKAILKKKTQLHRIAIQHKILISCFSRWKDAYKHCRNVKLTKELLSESCARRVACRWKLICYRRSLLRLFEVTQPERELRLTRVMFAKWVRSLDRRHREIEQADELYKKIQQHHLVFVFYFWKTETQRTLTIKPLVQRREMQIFMECFVGWRDFILQKNKCQQSKRAYQMQNLGKAFNSWRRQYQIWQIEKTIRSQMSQSLLLCFLKEWWFLIHRKRKGRCFNISRLMHRTFYHWRNRSTTRYTHRALMKREEEANLEIKRKYFTAWLENIQVQISWTEQCVGQCVQKQNKTVVLKAIVSWRQHMQSTLIARTYEKTQSQRFLYTVFIAWKELAHFSVSEAIHKFSERIGLTNYSDDETETKSSMNKFSFSHSMRSSFRLVGEDDLSLETDSDRMVLLTGGLQNYVDGHKAKCQRIKETITAVIYRLRHWPICVAFEQWKEFTARELTMKSAYNRLKAVHITAETSRVFRDWRSKFLAVKAAQKHRNAYLLAASFKSLLLYRDYRKYVKQQSICAWQHHMRVMFSKYFPPWLHKTQVQLKEKHVLHLWTLCTAREIELHPLENHLTTKLDKRSLSACFTLWLLKYQVVVKIRKVYQGHLLSWVFSAWQEWARERHDQAVRSLDMLHRRRTRMTFDLWLQKLHWIRQADQKYQVAWQNYLVLIMRQWHFWAKSNHQYRLSQRLFELQKSQHNLISYFSRWKSLVIKIKEIRTNQIKRLIYRAFCGWWWTVKKVRKDQHKVFEFQILSNILLVKRMFHKWHSGYIKCKLHQKERIHYAEQCAISAGIVWKKKARTAKGLRLQIIFRERKIVSHFQCWKSSLSNIRSLYDTLDLWTKKKNSGMMSQSLRSWKTQFIADQARKVHMQQFICTVIAEWHNFTKVSKERHIQGVVLKKALQDRNLSACFQYWLTVTRVKQSVQQNVETRLQIRILRTWHVYTRKKHNLREYQAQFERRVITHIVSNAFMNLRWRAEYCTSMQEMADKVVKDKERAFMRAVFSTWTDRLNKILAEKCYKHILAVRGTHRWQRFVDKRKLMQLKDVKNWQIAVGYHRHRICKRVFAVLKLEVKVSDLAERRRQNLCFKYARLWKNRVDMHITAITLEHEFAQRRVWNQWRLVFVKIKAVNHAIELLQSQSLYQVFTAWRRWCQMVNLKLMTQANLGSDRKVSSPLSSSLSLSVLPDMISRSRTSPVSIPPLPAANMSFMFKGGRRV